MSESDENINSTATCKSIKTDLELMSDGIDIHCDLEVPKHRSEWLNKELYDLGQKFFWDNPYPVLKCCLRSLLIGMSIPNLCIPLILTKRSETKGKSRTRYLQTIGHVSAWYTRTRSKHISPPKMQRSTSVEMAMPFEKVAKHHQQAAKFVRQWSKEDTRREQALSILNNLPDLQEFQGLSKLDEVLLENLSQLKEKHFKDEEFEFYSYYINTNTAFSQMDMALVQIAFVNLIALPDHFGVQHATSQDFTAFAHLWRVIGYYLGIKDEYNLLRLDTLEATRSLLTDVNNQILIPALLDLDEMSLHMIKMFSRAFYRDYHVIIYEYSLGLGLELKLLWCNFTVQQKIRHYCHKLLDYSYSKFPLFRKYFNKILNHFYKIFVQKIHAVFGVNTPMVRKSSTVLDSLNLLSPQNTKPFARL